MMIRRQIGDLLGIEFDDSLSDEPWAGWLAGFPAAEGAAMTEITIQDGPSRLPAWERVQRKDDGGWLATGRGHHLGALVETALLEHGHVLMHAAAVNAPTGAVLLSGASKSGKTTLLLGAMSDPAVSALADDKVVAAGDGIVTPVPTMVALRPHHAAVLPPGASADVIRALSTVTRLSRLPRPVRSVLRNLRRLAVRVGFGTAMPAANTQFAAVHADAVFGSRRASHGRLAACVILRPAPAPLRVVRRADAVAALVEALESDDGHREALDAAGVAGQLAAQDHRQRRRKLLDEALRHCEVIVELGLAPESDPREVWREISVAISAGDSQDG